MANLNLQLLIKAVDRASPALKRISRAVDQVSERTGLDRVGMRLRNVGQGLRNVGTEAEKFARRLGVGLLLGGGGLIAMTGRFAAAGDGIAKTADKLGIGVVELQRLRYAAQLAGVPVQTFDMALQRFSRRTSEAARGTGEARDVLKYLGIQLRDTNGNMRPTGQLLLDVADKWARLSKSVNQTDVAMRLFDTEGVVMVNMLKDGSGAIKDQGDEAERLGVITEEQARAAERYVDAQTKMKRSLEFLSHEVGSALLPDMEKLIGKMTEFFRTARPDATEEMRLAVKNLGAIAAASADAFDWLVGSGRKFLDWLEETFPAIKRWRDTGEGWLGDIGWLTTGVAALSAWLGRGLIFAVARAMIAIIAFGATLLTTPIGWMILGLAALAYGGWKLYQNWDEIVALGKGLWGDYGDWWQRNVTEGLGLPSYRTTDLEDDWARLLAWTSNSWHGLKRWWRAQGGPAIPRFTTTDAAASWRQFDAWIDRQWTSLDAWLRDRELKTALTGWWSGVEAAFQRQWEAVKAAVPASAWIESLEGLGLYRLYTALTGWWSGIASEFRRQWAAVKAAVPVAEWIADLRAEWQKFRDWLDDLIPDWLKIDLGIGAVNDNAPSANDNGRQPPWIAAMTPAAALAPPRPSPFAEGAGAAAAVDVGGEVRIILDGMRPGDRVEGVRSDNPEVPIELDASYTMASP